MGDVGKARMRMIHIQSERLLNQIAALFPAQYKLTLLARNPDDDNAHVILSVDDMDEVERAIRVLRRDHNIHESPGVL